MDGAAMHFLKVFVLGAVAHVGECWGYSKKARQVAPMIRVEVE